MSIAAAPRMLLGAAVSSSVVCFLRSNGCTRSGLQIENLGGISISDPFFVSSIDTSQKLCD